jgi:hypothetical protein
MRVPILVLTLAVLCFSFNKNICFGGWTFAKDLGAVKQEISNEKAEFEVGRMKCGAEATVFNRNPDDSVTEARILYCWTAPDTYVATFVNCNLPYYSVQALMIKKNNMLYQPNLTCGPNAKK